MSKTLRMGIRPSPLAFEQAKEIKRLLPLFSFEEVVFVTLGDKDKLTPLSEVGDADFFTREIDRALLSGEIDLAVHSSKDLPETLPDGLVIALETKSISRNDALVSRGNYTLAELPAGYKIGTSSLRRKAQLKALRPDLELVDIRGNIEERIRLIENGSIDALIVAHAALLRLGLEERASQILPLEIFDTHPKQGSLSVVVKEKTWQKAKYILSEPGRATGS